ncbi:TonB-dependent receptor [Massilia sp. CF038]|uniref:TonB-dependent receptor n=1 Tax=Massilia sp. CF038 TaxID=1881045 RepID=UPI00091E228F|nr:TonB-dependent receptor [Massilia sp. CF038]SHH06264.1 iron complex outermembrane recepter protein [Massilia sp. CF038]
MKPTCIIFAAACAAPLAFADDAVVIIEGGRPSSLPTAIPTTIESINGAQIQQRINATDSEDALKYFPSLNVRKRYIGDYDHAVLASRASGTGNSARSLVYADGILLSNLLGNGATYTPRWGLVSPEEIERVDVLYGPFSAAYPGNSVGAVVDFQTRMPDKLEAHVRMAAFSQPFAVYGTNDRFGGRQGSASLGDRSGAWSWWVDVSRLDSRGQPIAFANKALASGVVSSAGLPVTGAVADRNPSGNPWWILGASGQSHTVQDHAKVKLAWDLSPILRASYTLGWWDNDARRGTESYLRDASGAPVYRGDANNMINIAGRRYELRASDLAPSTGRLAHVMHGLSLKQHSKGVWDWEVAASKYDYVRDEVRTPTVPVAGLDSAGRGQLTNLGGSGWNTYAIKGIWRPVASHVVEMGLQGETAMLRNAVWASTDWRGDANGARLSTFNGNTRLQSLYLQDAWRMNAQWKTTLGMRYEHWRAFGGEISNASSAAPLPFNERSENNWSPKAAVAWKGEGDWGLKASLGRAVRNPTAAELFQGSIVDQVIINRDPNLHAERSWTGELTAEHGHGDSLLRVTLFHETTRDALYSQALTALVNTVQNVGRIRTNGLEVAHQMDHVLVPGLSLTSSVTYADSIIAENAGFAASVGKRQPRVPDWRANFMAAWQIDDKWSTTLGVRYSGRQFGTLDNSDPNGETYMGVSRYTVADVRVRYRFNRQWSAAVGVDNLNNATYWAFHPYTQRTVLAELRWDL